MGNVEKDDDLIKKALFKRAIGYEYEEKTIEADKDGKPRKIKIIKKHIPPDIKAIEEVYYMMAMGLWK